MVKCASHGVEGCDHAIYFKDPSLTKQSFKEECDVNEILKRSANGAVTNGADVRQAMYGDFTNIPSYQESLDLVNRANGMFMSMDAFIRERFRNDPREMIAFLQDPKNRDEAIKLGLVKAPEVAKPDEHLETLKSIDKGLRERSDSRSKKHSDGD